jgi:DNA-binding GntR family transcriptional regulator
MIRDLIARGTLRTNAPLIAEDLAKLCGISRTPVREAILRLQAEMFAVRLDNKRTVVRSWSDDEIEVFVELRVRLAGYTAARAAVRVTDNELLQLKEINARMSQLLGGRYDAGHFQNIGSEFYDLLGRIADSERLAQLSSHVLNPGPLLSILQQHAGPNDADMVSDHRNVIASLEARDPLWAEAAMALHVRKTYRKPR